MKTQKSTTLTSDHDREVFRNRVTACMADPRGREVLIHHIDLLRLVQDSEALAREDAKPVSIPAHVLDTAQYVKSHGLAMFVQKSIDLANFVLGLNSSAEAIQGSLQGVSVAQPPARKTFPRPEDVVQLTEARNRVRSIRFKHETLTGAIEDIQAAESKARLFIIELETGIKPGVVVRRQSPYPGPNCLLPIQIKTITPTANAKDFLDARITAEVHEPGQPNYGNVSCALRDLDPENSLSPITIPPVGWPNEL